MVRQWRHHCLTGKVFSSFSSVPHWRLENRSPMNSLFTDCIWSALYKPALHIRLYPRFYGRPIISPEWFPSKDIAVVKCQHYWPTNRAEINLGDMKRNLHIWSVSKNKTNDSVSCQCNSIIEFNMLSGHALWNMIVKFALLFVSGSDGVRAEVKKGD